MMVRLALQTNVMLHEWQDPLLAEIYLGLPILP
jgi:hypothetical protein